MQYKVECQYVGYLETLDIPRDQAFKVGMHAFSRHFVGQQIIRRLVRRDSPCRPYHQNERGPGTQAASSWLLHTYMDIFFDDRARSERWPDAEQAARLHHATNAADEWWTTEP